MCPFRAYHTILLFGFFVMFDRYGHFLLQTALTKHFIWLLIAIQVFRFHICCLWHHSATIFTFYLMTNKQYINGNMEKQHTHTPSFWSSQHVNKFFVPMLQHHFLLERCDSFKRHRRKIIFNGIFSNKVSMLFENNFVVAIMYCHLFTVYH